MTHPYLTFQRLGKVVEDRKPFAIATSEENKPKNRYDFVLPYDSNRVILAPLSTRPSSTYINASFVAVSCKAERDISTWNLCYWMYRSYY